MANSSISHLVEKLGQSALLKPAQLKQLTEELQERFPETRALARELIERGWVTSYQMEHVLLGREQELSIGPYDLLDVVGQGAMGLVFKARHRKGGHIVALKVVRKDQVSNPRVLSRFRREIRAVTRLAHPNLVTACDISEVDEAGFFAMEFVEGVNLHDVVRECGPLPLAPACDYVRQAANGLHHAYERGLIHRDIKPANLLITPPTVPATGDARQGRWGVVKILDLGLALLQQRGSDRPDSFTHLTAKGLMLGTVDYIAPEQVMSPHEVDIRADLYSLGCTFYELLTGQVPFPDGSPGKKLFCHQETEPLPVEQFRPSLPPELALVVHKLMAKAPRARFQTPAHLSATLATVLNSLDPATVEWDWRPPHLAETPSPALSQIVPMGEGRRWWPLLVGAGLVVLLLALVLLVLSLRK
jgi:eukaryotic-like serine/threonine-protein kinase